MTRFLDELLADGLLIDAGAEGLYGRSARFEAIVEAIDLVFSRISAADGAERVRFPPAMPRAGLERSRYMQSFPQLAGTIHCFCGDERAHRDLLRCIEAGEDWSGYESASELALIAAACYPIYPMMAARGPLPADGRLVDVMSWCFRHEPSLNPARMQFFRIREQICLGSPAMVEAFRDLWMERAAAFAESLGLPYSLEEASDPFFGRPGKLKADSQRSQRLKFELLIPGEEEVGQVACASFNHHQDHFAGIWEIGGANGGVVNTGCVGFGLDRLALALLCHHGRDCDVWPASIRGVLWP